MIHTLHKYLPKEQVSNEVVASVNALTSTKDLPADPKEGQSYHVNGVDWVYVKGEWVTRQGIYGHEDFGDAHEPLFDGTGEPPSIDTQRSESKETRELSDEPAVTSAADQNDKSGEEVVTENASTDATTTAPETEPAVAPEATPQTEASTETPSEEPSSEPESTEEVPEKTEHENIEERENEAADKPDAAEEAEDDTPANESIIEQAPLAHPVEDPVAPVLEGTVIEEPNFELAHDRVKEVSSHIQQLSHAQQALESYYDMVKNSKRISRQEAAILHINLTAIDKTFNLKTKATGLESYGVTPRDAMEKATVSTESVTERMKQIGGAIYKKIKELFERLIEILSQMEIFSDKVKSRAEAGLEKLRSVPANAEPVNKQFKFSGSHFLYDKSGFKGTKLSDEKPTFQKLSSAASKLYAEMRQIGTAYVKATKLRRDEDIEIVNEAISNLNSRKNELELNQVSGGWSIGIEGPKVSVTYDKYDAKDSDKPVSIIDRNEIKRGLTDLIEFSKTTLNVASLRKTLSAIRGDVNDNIKRGREQAIPTEDEKVMQALQSAYVNCAMKCVAEFNMKDISTYYSQLMVAKLKYLELNIQNLQVKGAGMESIDPYTFSNESIFTELGHFFNKVIHGKKSDINMMQADKAIEEIRKTYANSSWLKNRRFIEGEVEFKADPGIDKNFKTEIAKAVGNLKQGQRGNAAVYTRATKVIEPWTSYLIKQTYKTDPSKLDKLSTTVPKFDPNKYKPVQYSGGRDFDYGKVKKEALTQEEVATAANEVIQAAEFVQTFWKGMLGEEFWSTFNVELNGGIYGRFVPLKIEGTNNYTDVIQGIANNLSGEEQASAVRMATAINNYCVSAEMSLSKGTTLSHYDFYFGYIRGLMNWIDASTR